MIQLFFAIINEAKKVPPELDGPMPEKVEAFADKVPLEMHGPMLEKVDKAWGEQVSGEVDGTMPE